MYLALPPNASERARRVVVALARDIVRELEKRTGAGARLDAHAVLVRDPGSCRDGLEGNFVTVTARLRLAEIVLSTQPDLALRMRRRPRHDGVWVVCVFGSAMESFWCGLEGALRPAAAKVQ